MRSPRRQRHRRTEKSLIQAARRRWRGRLARPSSSSSARSARPQPSGVANRPGLLPRHRRARSLPVGRRDDGRASRPSMQQSQAQKGTKDDRKDIDPLRTPKRVIRDGQPPSAIPDEEDTAVHSSRRSTVHAPRNGHDGPNGAGQGEPGQRPGATSGRAVSLMQLPRLMRLGGLSALRPHAWQGDQPDTRRRPRRRRSPRTRSRSTPSGSVS